MAQAAVKLRPNEPQGNHQLGLCFLDLRDWPSAEAQLRKAANLAPHNAATQASLGIVLEHLGRAAEARRCFQRATTLNPRYVLGLIELGNSLVRELDFSRAEECARQILAIEPNSANGHRLMANALVGAGRPAEARNHADRLLELEPGKAEPLTVYGTVLESMGLMEEAAGYFRQAAELDTLQGYPYYCLVRSRKVGADELRLVTRMEAALRNPALKPDSKGDLEFALGKAYTDLGDFSPAMHHYDAGNTVFEETRLGKVSLDQGRYRAGNDFVIRTIDRKFIEVNREFGSADDLPIWVMGMVRSGTTLAEQILSSHPDVAGAGELRFWMDNRKTVITPSNEIDPLNLEEAARAYVSLLRRKGPGATRVVDKLPGTYMHAGLLHLAFPKGKFIHMRRHPVDTCLSIWTTRNAATMEWSYVKKNIAFAYREYLRLMEHWRSVIPPQAMMEVDYEALVERPNEIIPAIIEFCGLDWDERCLRPDRNTRPVFTPSDWQVRQPIYRSSVDSWRRFEPWLGEFREFLTND
jgi:tetratricopeptide (TPR) repeat protein